MMRTGTIAEDENTVKCELAVEVLRSFGTLRFVATGWSMLPFLWPGETLVVERISRDNETDNETNQDQDKDKDRVRVGDVVLVRRGSGLCAHRVVAVAGTSENPQWITRGDALPAPDRPVAPKALLGRVAYVIREGRLIALSADLSAAESLIARIVRRSVLAARTFVYLNRLLHTSEKPVLPCQN
ncbi:MAG: S24/S26 family peptidase [Candidatus Sulfotelmatobacter sp.]